LLLLQLQFSSAKTEAIPWTDAVLQTGWQVLLSLKSGMALEVMFTH
jgi:hypothetical protein